MFEKLKQKGTYMKEGKLFVHRERGALLRILLQKTNQGSGSEKLPKLSYDIAVYLATRGRRNIQKKFFFSNLESLAKRVCRFVGREKLPSRGAMSAALSSLERCGLYKYVVDVPNNKSKHGSKKGIKLELIEQFE